MGAGQPSPVDSMAAMLARLSQRCTPATIIDVGASDGSWSAMALQHWPGAKVLCIEADSRHWQALDAFAAAGGHHAVHAMAGDHVGVGNFAATADPYGGQGSDTARADTREVPCTTVDREVARLGLPAPYLLKLDTHGYEPWILLGAMETLKRCCALVIEAYTCELQPNAFCFWELCEDLTDYGFSPTDIADVMRRPLDGRWWQMDLCFERSDALHVGEGRYR